MVGAYSTHFGALANTLFEWRCEAMAPTTALAAIVWAVLSRYSPLRLRSWLRLKQLLVAILGYKHRILTNKHLSEQLQ